LQEGPAPGGSPDIKRDIMKTKVLLIAIAILGYCNAKAQFSITPRSTVAQNNSGFLIEKSLSTSGGYIIVNTTYANTGPLSPTNGIRIMEVDNFGSVLWDRKYTSFPHVRVLDICRHPANGTYLITGYVGQAAINRLFIAQIGPAGGVTGFIYYPVGMFSSYHHHGMSITTFNGGSVAVTGVATSLSPVPNNASAQSNVIFVATFTPALTPVNLTYHNHATPGYQDIPLHIMDVPSTGYLHVTGSSKSNIPGTLSATMNIFFNYNGNYVWEQSIIDPAESGEIGQYAYYDDFYDLIFILSYATPSNMAKVYAVAPTPGVGVLAVSRYNDPSGAIATIYGLTLTKDNVNSPNELFISGYLPDNPIYYPTTMPAFTTSLYIPDLLNIIPGSSPFYTYPNPDNSGYRFFNFSNDMFANSNPVLNMPTNLGYTSQMAVMDNNMNIVMATPRFSQMFGGYHPTISQNSFYYWHACTSLISSVQFDPRPFIEVTDLNPLIQTIFSRSSLLGSTGLPTIIYDCYDFLAPNNENTLSDEDQTMTGYKLYPTVVNEASADITFEFTDAASHNLTISIYDAAGRKIFQQHAGSNAGENRIIIRAENLAKGMNIIHVTGLEEPLTTKILRN